PHAMSKLAGICVASVPQKPPAAHFVRRFAARRRPSEYAAPAPPGGPPAWRSPHAATTLENIRRTRESRHD
ncbi:hypothetical protein NX847_31360, partial [Burkholderia thailandensis]|uniref:hypothetical protein n=1 Tax=Burkholderia thailandensis TaxID=57975 RepID=UPI00217E3EB5